MPCSQGRVKIGRIVERQLYSDSAGYCQRPECLTSLFVSLASGLVAGIGECAHIVAYADKGPRAIVAVVVTDRNAYDNLILLCPSCHRIIDDHPADFPVDIVLGWKTDHVRRLRGAFEVPVFSRRHELAKAVHGLLRNNREVFLTYGPHSGEFRGISDAARMWNQYSVSTIIPNNRKISELLVKNDHLLKEVEQRIGSQFRLHAEGFEFNHLTGDRNASVPLFPDEMNGILSGE